MSERRPRLGPGQRLLLHGSRMLVEAVGRLDGLRPLPDHEPLTTHRYGSGRRQILDHLPARAGVASRAPVVFIHGGGWILGSKDLYTRDLLFLSEAGYPVFNLEYGLAPENPHPGILLDLLRALRWIRAYFPQWESVHLMGDSAGGNLALVLGILCTNPSLLKDLDGERELRVPVRPRSVVSLYGVHDRLSWIHNGFLGARLMLQSYGGREAFAAEVASDLAITAADLRFDLFPPTFLASASKDPLAESSRLCADQLREASGQVTARIYDGERHGFFHMRRRPASQALRRDILEFLDRL